MGAYWFHHGCLSVHLSVRLSVEKWFLHDNSFSFCITIMIPHIWVDNDLRRTSIKFRVKRWKVKVKFGLWSFYRFHRITPFPFGIYWRHFTHALTMTRVGPLLSLGSKDQRSRSHLDSQLYHESRRTPIEFRVKRFRLNWESLNVLSRGAFLPFRTGFIAFW